MRHLNRTLPGAIACALFLSWSICAQQQGNARTLRAYVGGADEKSGPADQSKFAVIISGASGEAIFAKQFANWSEKLKLALIEKLGFASEQVWLLAEKPASGAGQATAAEVKQVLGALQKAVKADGKVFVFFIGHGTYDGQQAKFNLVGPDLTVNQYKELLDALPAKSVVVVNMASASGEFIKPLAAPERVLITAKRSGQEQNATRFSEHFIAALGSSAADADKNNRISVLEAFNYATKLTAETYKSANQLATEHALLDDNGDGVGHQTAEAGDGALARETYFDSAAQPQIASDHESLRLTAEQKRVESLIQSLKARKAQLAADEYYAQLEVLFVDLAKLTRELKSKNKIGN
ncbi:MAG: hypothetical protein WKF30_05395 [Pyrinomonadaceae bacterium]